ncbi:hypothetical protein M0R36_10550 [bacterium]|nr:hypothetical protein [bacterium]
MTITAPDGSTAVVLGFTSDIHLSVDPGTGELVSGCKASVSVLISDLEDAGFGAIHSVADSSSRPWLITMADSKGTETVYKVVETNPDRSVGLMLIFLGEYEQ